MVLHSCECTLCSRFNEKIFLQEEPRSVAIGGGGEVTYVPGRQGIRPPKQGYRGTKTRFTKREKEHISKIDGQIKR